MGSWDGWRERAKKWKKDKDISDVKIALDVSISVGRKVSRTTLNSWLNKREPNLREFIYLCEAMGAEPDKILFGFPPLQELPRPAKANGTAKPGAHATKVREFKKNKTRTRTRPRVLG